MAPPKKRKGSSRGKVGPTPSFSTFQASSAPESPNTSPAPDTSGSSGGSFSPTLLVQATTSSASQVHSNLVFGLLPPGTYYLTGVSGLSETPFSPSPQATGSAPQDTSTAGAPSTPKVPIASRKIPEMASKKSPPIPFDK